MFSAKLRPWWDSAVADNEQQAQAFCKRMGTGQCAALCLTHSSLHTSDGKCPEAVRVWMHSRKGAQP